MVGFVKKKKNTVTLEAEVWKKHKANTKKGPWFREQGSSEEEKITVVHLQEGQKWPFLSDYGRISKEGTFSVFTSTR